MINTYTSLHCHYADGSVGDSILKPSEAVKKAKELGMESLAITDHGSMASCIKFYKECKEQGIKPLLGLEAYEAVDREEKNRQYYHTVLLAKNEQGYKDLLSISADSQFKGFYYKPRTDMSVLKKYGKNIIGLSACIGGRIPKKILEVLKLAENGLPEDYEAPMEMWNMTSEEILNTLIAKKANEIIEIVNDYKACFADFYLELQPGDFLEQRRVNEALISLAEETNTKLVITNDVHYLNKEDWKNHDLHVKMARKQKHDAPDVYPAKDYYLMGYEEIRNLFPYIDQDIIEEAIANTNRIAEQIDLGELYDGKIKMPKADTPIGYSEDEYLAKIVIDKLNQKKYELKDPSYYYTRAEYELDTLREVGFSGYLLIIKDLYDYSEKKHIVMGPGRGSIGGSLVAWLLDITKVDPIKYNLLFERFISKHRKGSVPDIDIDVASSQRQLLFDYVVDKYGEECCALVSTFTIRKARSAIKDTARIFDIEMDKADYVAKLVPQVYYNDEDGEKQTDLSIEEALEISSELREVKKEHEDWFAAALALENIAKTTSIHAAGTLISPKPLKDYIPLIKNKKDGMMATALNLGDAEYCGAIKYDFLGLSTMDIIAHTEKRVGVRMDFNDDSWLHDEEVWKLIGSKNTTTLFQIGSDTYKKRMHRLKAMSIEDLAACLALVRGPCISSKLDEQYMQIVEGRREIELIHPFYDSVTKDTRGVMLYQEQLMNVLVNFGFSLEDGFRIMKYAAKKKQDKLKEAESKFNELAEQSRVPANIASRIWEIILDSGKYSFNASHATAYALICYYSAYLKTHYPVEWMCSALTNAYDRKENIPEVVQECRRLGIRFLGLDINKSSWEFTPEGRNIRIGFVGVKGLGEVAYNALNDNRPYSNLKEVTESVTNKFNKKAFVLSIFAGAFDFYDEDRLSIYREYCEIRDEEPMEVISISKDMKIKSNDDLESIEEVLFEISLARNPVQYFDIIDYSSINFGEVFNLQAIVRKVKKIKDKNGNRMAFLTIETSSGYLEATIFSNQYKGNTKYMNKGKTLLLKAKKDKAGIIVQEFIA